MKEGQDLAKIIENFLAKKKENNRELSSDNSGDLSLPNKSKEKELEKEVIFWSNTAQTHLKSLQRLEAENDSKDLTIQELKTTIQQLKKQLNEIANKLQDTINNHCFLTDLVETKVD
jgi:predicted RNase H-like nuclease (RuvC/YqgF family)